MGLDRQKAFDIAGLRILEQKRPSLDLSGLCRYRTYLPEAELRCTIGWLIPDYRYHPSLEDHAGGHIDHVAHRALATDLGTDPCKEDIGLLAALRFAHDASANALRYGNCSIFLAEFIRRMQIVARRYGLDPCCVERRRVVPSGSHHGQYVFNGIL